MNSVTEKFVEIARPYYEQMCDSLKNHFEARKSKNLEEIEKLGKESYVRNADLQAIFQALFDACSELNISIFDVLDQSEIDKTFIGCFFISWIFFPTT